MKKDYKNIIIVTKKLEDKKAELKQRQDYFNVMCHNEMDSKTFERNAINDLLIMLQLKSEISELEHLVKLYKATEKTN